MRLTSFFLAVALAVSAHAATADLPSIQWDTRQCGPNEPDFHKNFRIGEIKNRLGLNQAIQRRHDASVALYFLSQNDPNNQAERDRLQREYDDATKTFDYWTRELEKVLATCEAEVIGSKPQ